MNKIGIAVVLLCGLVLGSGAARGQDQAQLMKQVAALKAALQTSQENLKHYEWVETSVFSLKGEEKSRTQSRCYYGADGALQKVALTDKPEEKKKRGLRGKIVEKKKDEMSDYMDRAQALIKHYVPPDSARIQAAMNTGKVAQLKLEGGRKIRLEFRDYIKSGDVLGVEIDAVTGKLSGLTVASYLDDPDDRVTLAVEMATLDDGTNYSKRVGLAAEAKKVTIETVNSGYRLTGQ